MLEIKASERWISFWNSDRPITSPRARFLISEHKKDLGRVVRQIRSGVVSSVPISKEFEEGYELVGLNYIRDLQSFYTKKGIDYVIGVVSRFKDEGKFECFNKNYREAVKFREKYDSDL